MTHVPYPRFRRLIVGGLLIGMAGALASCDRMKSADGHDTAEEAKARLEETIIETAYQEAHRSVQDFIVELGTVRADYRYLVKMRVQEEKEAEYVWVEPASYLNGTFFGPIANEPARLTAVKKGEVIKARVKDIYDWVILDHADKLIAGGFTQKVAQRQKTKRKP